VPAGLTPYARGGLPLLPQIACVPAQAPVMAQVQQRGMEFGGGGGSRDGRCPCSSPRRVEGIRASVCVCACVCFLVSVVCAWVHVHACVLACACVFVHVRCVCGVRASISAQHAVLMSLFAYPSSSFIWPSSYILPPRLPRRCRSRRFRCACMCLRMSAFLLVSCVCACVYVSECLYCCVIFCFRVYLRLLEDVSCCLTI
jgi:hypothetical protein